MDNYICCKILGIEYCFNCARILAKAGEHVIIKASKGGDKYPRPACAKCDKRLNEDEED